MMRRPGTTVFNRKEIKVKKAENIARQTERRNGRIMDGTIMAADSLTLFRSIHANEKDKHYIQMEPIGSGFPDGEKFVSTLPNLSNGKISLKSSSTHMMTSYESDLEQSGALQEMNKCMQKACLELRSISGQIKIMRKRMEEDERDEQAENDWKFAAIVVDRLCLFIFTIFIVVSTCGIMFSSPHLIA
ncbi:hypothetical protein DICVIV_13174 [Dictyocaulus viviparus]|uniref:Neurotransmitter-gated ion-channel transmembrane domain-containing protein n=1 Tax=Dictyocaulus viviparus TaxID=29172 RepID=A0A0D8X8J3_DICVI|nr:hypothetical protein DICVIV_13174 [Dictyocaulus viviparus]